MSMKKRLTIISIMCVLVMTMITTQVKASSCTVALTPSNTTVAKESSVTVVISLSDIDAGDGIYILSAVIDYDTDIFEEITSDNITVDSSSGWTPTYASENKKLTLTNANFISTNTDIATITFTVKSGIEANEATIALTEITASSADGDFQPTDVSTKLTITDATIIISNNIVDTNDVNNIVVDPNFANEVNAILNENTSSNSDVPYTGVEDYIVPFITIVIVLGIISFINYKKIDSNEKKK